MGAMLDKLDGVHGPVDERLVRKYLLDGCLSRETWVKVRDTDRTFARYVGAVLTAAHADSTDIADAHAVAAAVEGGGGVILTGAESDISRLSASFRHVHVAPI